MPICWPNLADPTPNPTRLLHNPCLLASGLSVGYETWAVELDFEAVYVPSSVVISCQLPFSVPHFHDLHDFKDLFNKEFMSS